MTQRPKRDCLILIPARSGSKGIPWKNMAIVGGKPLIEHTIVAALKAALPGRICVSTDDETIRKFCLTFPLEAPFLRPALLAGDETATVPVINHAVDWYEKEEGFSPEFIVLLQPTNPFRTYQDIKGAYELIVSAKANTLISVNQVGEHPCEYVVCTNEGFDFVMEPPEKPGRQNFPKVFFINGAIYIASVEYFKKNGRLFDKTALLYIMSQSNSLDIDTPEDIDYANWYITKREP